MKRVENQELDIIIGTQMISKGLDFDHVDLVVVPKSDAMLHIQDSGRRKSLSALHPDGRTRRKNFATRKNAASDL